MLVDYHIHTPYCGHAQGRIADYVDSALAAGLHQIAFTDHLGRYYLSPSQRKRHFDWGMDNAKLRRYVEELMHLRDVYEGRIDIRIGLEIDFIEGAEHLLTPILQTFPFDFLLGSLHCLPVLGWRHMADYSHERPERVFEEYFRMAAALIESRLFHSLAHLDFLWRYVKWPKSQSFDPMQAISATIEAAGHAGMAVELNANGYLWSQLYRLRQGDPFDVMLDEIRRHKVPVTLGSDAHSPEHVAKSFPNLLDLLKNKGIPSVAVFRGGVRNLVSLG